MNRHTVFLSALLLCLLLLTSCGEKDWYFAGQPSDVRLVGDGTPASFILTNADGRRMGFLVTERTAILSRVDGIDALDFFQSPTRRAHISVSYDSGKTTLTASDGQKIAAYPARFVILENVLIPDAATLQDGTSLDMLQWSGSVTYCLPDGTALLNVRDIVDAALDSQAVNDDLSETAQKKISAYYEERGLLYSVEDELERAYANRPTHVNDQPVPGLGQEIFSTGTAKRVIYITTTLTLPVYGSPTANATETSLCDAFDRESGQRIDVWDLFTCSPEETKRALLDLAQITEQPLRGEMEAAFRQEYIQFYPSGLQVFFPKGALPSVGTALGFGLDYDDSLRAILQDWAVPE